MIGKLGISSLGLLSTSLFSNPFLIGYAVMPNLLAVLSKDCCRIA
jgi:hypothetical protein